MIEYAVVGVVALLASLMSFFSGFGLGTTLMPVMTLFFPLPMAIALTAVIHLFHNGMKTGLLWNSIDWKVVTRFGSSALLAAIPGALLLKGLSDVKVIGEYSLMGVRAEVSILHICIGSLLILFATMQAFPLKRYRVHNLYLGGAISGFFGGLTGHQGALRSLFLVNTSQDQKAFIGTTALIAVVIDVCRLVIYTSSFHHLLEGSNLPLIAVAIGATLGGIFFAMM